MSNKFNAKRIEIDGHNFASKVEARRYGELKLLQMAREIRDLECQPKFDLVVNGTKVGKYTPDFSYWTANHRVIEEIKGKATAKDEAYRLRLKVFQACYPGVKVTEIVT